MDSEVRRRIAYEIQGYLCADRRTQLRNILRTYRKIGVGIKEKEEDFLVQLDLILSLPRIDNLEDV